MIRDESARKAFFAGDMEIVQEYIEHLEGKAQRLLQFEDKLNKLVDAKETEVLKHFEEFKVS